MVVRANHTPKELVNAAIDALYGVTVHGLVLNEVDGARGRHAAHRRPTARRRRRFRPRGSEPCRFGRTSSRASSAFFVGEQLLLFGAFVVDGAVVARGLGVSADWLRVLVEAACATAALQVGLYLADLYDFKVAYTDAPRATRLLKAIGATTIVCGVGDAA